MMLFWENDGIFRISSRSEKAGLSEQEMKMPHPINNPLEQESSQSRVDGSSQPQPETRNHSRDYFKNFNVDSYTADKSAGI